MANSSLRSTRFRRLWLLLFSVPFMLCPVSFLVAPILLGSQTPADLLTLFLSAIGAMLSVAALFLIGGGVTAYALWPLFVAVRVGSPEVTVSTSRLRVGETAVLSFRQPFHRAVEVRRVTVALVFRETARYRHGKHTHSVHHERKVAEFEYPGGSFEPGNDFAFSSRLEIPLDGMHSFAGNHNWLEWIVRLRVEVAGWADFNQDYPLTVIPQRAR